MPYQESSTTSKQHNDLEALQKEFENFAYIVSHDLQAPLRSVVNFSKLLQERYQDVFDEKGNKHFGYVIDGAAHMQQMVEGLLSYSRLNTTHLEPSTVSLSNILGKVHVGCKAEIAQSQATINTVGELPEIHGEIERIMQVFQHLVDNAIKFQLPGQKPEIWIEAAKQPDGYYLISVKDNGIGIDPKKFQEVFTMFRRLNKVSEYPGLGIGLTLAKKIIELHNGAMWVESELGKGSIFYFTIPGDK